MIKLAPTHPQAIAAVKTARLWHQCGSYAMSRYAAANRVPTPLLTLARVLATAERAGL